jgi:glycosyltransferase involved in cell wall biosynthesis
MSQSQKQVSVLIASDDLGTRLPKLLQSLENQTVPNWKVVVIDNSGDRPVSFMPPVYVLRNPRPQSLARSTAQAIELASGSEFFLLAKSDLVFAPGFLQAMLEAFENDPSLVYAWPAIARASFDPESGEGELVYGDDRVQPRRLEDLGAACLMLRAADLGNLRPEERLSDEVTIQDLVWKLSQSGAKGTQIEEAVAWLQPGATLASPGFFRYWTWVWTRRAPRS